MNFRVIATLTALALAACSGDQGDETGGEAQADGASSAPIEADAPFDHPVYSLDHALDTELFGLKLNMTPEEVVAELEAKGFQPPDDYERSDLTIDCGEACSVGLSQNERSATEWTRTSADGAGTETIKPVFYVSADKGQKLMRAVYTRKEDAKVDPEKSIAAVAERFGEPTVSMDDRAFYAIQLEIPEAYETTAEDTRSPKNGYTEQRAVVQDRLGCLMDESNNFPAPRTDECKRIMAGDAYRQALFEALDDGQDANVFLWIFSRGSKLEVTLDGGFLSSALYKQLRYERKMAELAERRGASEREIGVASDM